MPWLPLFAASVILIHSAPSGMVYDPQCCGNMDCHPIPCEELTEAKDGLHWKDLVFTGDKIKPSQDSSCHVCEHTWGDKHIGYCVYIRTSS